MTSTARTPRHYARRGRARPLRLGDVSTLGGHRLAVRVEVKGSTGRTIEDSWGRLTSIDSAARDDYLMRSPSVRMSPPGRARAS